MNEAFYDEIRELLASGNKIAAFKRYREQTGVGLAEAKAAVESLEAIGSFTRSFPIDDSELTQQIVSLLGCREKIEAVKMYRDRFRVGLKEAKEKENSTCTNLFHRAKNYDPLQYGKAFHHDGQSTDWLHRRLKTARDRNTLSLIDTCNLTTWGSLRGEAIGHNSFERLQVVLAFAYFK